MPLKKYSWVCQIWETECFVHSNFDNQGTAYSIYMWDKKV